MRGKTLAALLLMGAAACSDTGTSAGGDDSGQTGLIGGKGEVGPSGVNPSAALAASTARDCPQRCAFAIGDRAGQPAAREAASVTEDAGVLLLGGSAPVRWTLSMGSRVLKTPAGHDGALINKQNGWGQAVGYAFGSPPAATAWEPDGTPIVLSDRPYGPPLGGDARSINDNSVIVGVSNSLRAFRTHYKEGFRWLSESQSGANDVNFKGQVVGYSTIGGVWHATLWAPDGTPTDLGILPYSWLYSEATAISETGIVVGYSANNGNKQGFIWTASEGLKPLPDGFIPSDVNHWGEVAGQLWQTGECAVWYKGYGMLKLPRLVTGSRECKATSINSWGDVVGYEVFSPNEGRTYVAKAVLWTWGGNEGRYGF